VKSNTPNPSVIAPAVGGIFFPVAKKLQRPVRESVTPLVLEKVVWAGANMVSYRQAVNALSRLSDIALAAKQVQRITSQVGSDCVDWRDAQVKQHAESPLMKRTTLKPGTTPQELSVVMMDGGRF
jgi:uncharacterized protein YjiS (DUF1127 family)